MKIITFVIITVLGVWLGSYFESADAKVAMFFRDVVIEVRIWSIIILIYALFAIYYLWLVFKQNISNSYRKLLLWGYKNRTAKIQDTLANLFVSELQLQPQDSLKQKLSLLKLNKDNKLLSTHLRATVILSSLYATTGMQNNKAYKSQLQLWRQLDQEIKQEFRGLFYAIKTHNFLNSTAYTHIKNTSTSLSNKDIKAKKLNDALAKELVNELLKNAQNNSAFSIIQLTNLCLSYPTHLCKLLPLLKQVALYYNGNLNQLALVLMPVWLEQHQAEVTENNNKLLVLYKQLPKAFQEQASVIIFVAQYLYKANKINDVADNFLYKWLDKKVSSYGSTGSLEQQKVMAYYATIAKTNKQFDTLQKAQSTLTTQDISLALLQTMLALSIKLERPALVDQYTNLVAQKIKLNIPSYS